MWLIKDDRPWAPASPADVGEASVCVFVLHPAAAMLACFCCFLSEDGTISADLVRCSNISVVASYLFFNHLMETFINEVGVKLG